MAPRTLVVGDSLGVGTIPYLRKLLMGQIDVDVKGGRSSQDGVNSLQRRRGTRYDRILLDLGTNDSSAGLTRASIERARKLAPGAQIVVATVHGPDAAAKNRMLRRMPGVTLVDWAGKSGGLMAGDGIHASGKGYQQRARMMAGALRVGAAGGGAREPAAAPAAPDQPAPAPDPQALASLLAPRQAPRQSAGLSLPQFSAAPAQPQDNPLELALRKVMTKWR